MGFSIRISKNKDKKDDFDKKFDEFMKDFPAFYKPEIQLRCKKCGFMWVANPSTPPISLKKLYEENKTCPKCGSEKVELLFKPISTF